MAKNIRHPSILVPFKERACDTQGSCQDVFVYLRPESNGVLVESTMLKVIKDNKVFRDNVELAYLANLPGDFIMRNLIVESHYAVRLHFAVRGKRSFTDQMKKKFEAFFQVPFEGAKILGAFSALRELGVNAEELFKLWVPPYEMTVINGQVIKRRGDVFIVNYDIPAILHKNNKNTDIAVMILRTGLDWDTFHELVESMTIALIDRGILDPTKPPSRIFHFSKGPFEQILDGIGYFYNKEGAHEAIEKLSFTRFLLDKGYTMEEIHGVLRYPIMEFCHSDGKIEENDIFTCTQGDTFEEAERKLRSTVCQIKLRV